MTTTRIHLQYGTTGIPVDLPSANVHVIEPRFVPGLPDEAEAFRTAVRAPLAGPPLRDRIAAHERVAVVIPDGTTGDSIEANREDWSALGSLRRLEAPQVASEVPALAEFCGGGGLWVLTIF